MTTITGSYDLHLVALSVLIAVLAAGAALDLAGRVTASRGRQRVVWLAGGAIAMGLGIWSMHYTGMLAFRFPVPVEYHVPTVGLSLLAAVLASAVALYVASRERLTAGRTLLGSLAMGSGIAAMHYIGMAAMRMPATVQWSGGVITLSVLIAITVSTVALWLAFRFGHAAREAWTWRKAGSALLMGAAIPSMHYTGMAAAAFSTSTAPVDVSHTVSLSALGADAIAAVTLLVMLVAILSSVIDRRFAAMHFTVRAGRDLLEAVVEGSGEAVFAKDVDGHYILANTATAALVGRRLDQLIGHTDAELFPAAIADRLREADRQIIAAGTTRVHEETFQHADGPRTRLVSEGPLRGAGGKIVGVVGLARDITARKRAEEEQQIMLRELQTALAEVKTLRGLVTVCAQCRRVRNDAGGWQQIESYVREHSKAEFSHGLCPDCARRWDEAGV